MISPQQACKHFIEALQRANTLCSTKLFSTLHLPCYLSYNEGHVNIATNGSTATLHTVVDGALGSGGGDDDDDHDHDDDGGGGGRSAERNPLIPQQYRGGVNHRTAGMGMGAGRRSVSLNTDNGSTGTGTGTTPSMSSKIIRANTHVPKSLAVHYFEVTVLEDRSSDRSALTQHRGDRGADNVDRSLVTAPIVVGLCTKNASHSGTIPTDPDEVLHQQQQQQRRMYMRRPQQQQQQQHPGPLDNMFFYVSNTGNKNVLHRYGSPFGRGDTVGCLFNLLQSTVSFTKNGILMGTAFTDVGTKFEQINLIPFVGLSSEGQSVEVNFGRTPFVYDFQSACQECMDMVNDSIDRTDYMTLLPPVDTSSFVVDRGSGVHTQSTTGTGTVANDRPTTKRSTLLSNLLQRSCNEKERLNADTLLHGLVMEYLILQGHANTAQTLTQGNEMIWSVDKQGSEHSCVRDVFLRQSMSFTVILILLQNSLFSLSSPCRDHEQYIGRRHWESTSVTGAAISRDLGKATRLGILSEMPAVL